MTGLALWALAACAQEEAVTPLVVEVPPSGLALASTNLPDKAEEIIQAHFDSTDRSETFYTTEVASAHMHVIGVDQLCPLHVHRTANEATIIVTGSPDVAHVYAEEGERVETQEQFGPGSLVSSPPFTGHEWDNNTGAHQANLVLAYPSFDGNLYLRPDDPRMDQGTAPFSYHPDDDVEDFVASGQPFDRLDLPIMEGRMSRLFVGEQYELPATSEDHGLLYAVSGEGMLRGAGTERAITPGTLLVFLRPAPVVIEATGDQPLALYLFEPPVTN
ncbi:MAG TPA: cupin domain-containing protein [Myxococcota bacterium]|nr:cupin domain-containing protein [Myxococcota bacterium]